jgi:hypothetical protein
MEASAGRWQAERAVLDAVADWCAGRASQGRIAEAYDALQVVLAANGM